MKVRGIGAGQKDAEECRGEAYIDPKCIEAHECLRT